MPLQRPRCSAIIAPPDERGAIDPDSARVAWRLYVAVLGLLDEPDNGLTHIVVRDGFQHGVAQGRHTASVRAPRASRVPLGDSRGVASEAASAVGGLTLRVETQQAPIKLLQRARELYQ